MKDLKLQLLFKKCTKTPTSMEADETKGHKESKKQRQQTNIQCLHNYSSGVLREEFT